MPSKRASIALFDIRDNARLAQEFAAGLSRDTLKADRRTFYAVTRYLEIISEAARRMPPSLRERRPELPWREIMGIGNVSRHDYDNVAEEIGGCTTALSHCSPLSRTKSPICPLSPHWHHLLPACLIAGNAASPGNIDIPLPTLRNWEQVRRQPDAPAAALPPRDRDAPARNQRSSQGVMAWSRVVRSIYALILGDAGEQGRAGGRASRAYVPPGRRE